MSDRSRLLLMAALLVGVTLAALAPVVRSGFLSYDDDQYVTSNPHVQRGVSVSSLRWAFTATRAANWHPLTWVSHMLDWRIYGDRAWGHHLTSLILHVASALLLFLVLHAMTGSVGRSGFVAALFAVHPLHVESVAWVAERKDVLGGLLWTLTTAAYVGWVRRPRATRYALVVLAFAAGLAAKPMLVTLPFTLLLLDVWPLARWRDSWQGTWRLFREKFPLFVLSAASSAVTLLAQRRGGAIASFSSYPPAIRLENAVVSYVVYLGKTIVPSGLSFFYPHGHEPPPLWQIVGSALLLLAITGAAFRTRARFPYLLVGWLWYLGTLVPVIGLVQVGSQAMADRYTYVPLVGIFVIVAWGCADLASRAGAARWLPAAAGAVVLALGIVTNVQAGYWQDSLALFGHALEVDQDNYMAHYNLGVELVRRGRIEEALAHYTEALRIRPRFAKTHTSLANIHLNQGKLDEAEREAREAIRLDPNQALAHYCLGGIAVRRGRAQEAVTHYEQALRIDPEDARVHNNLGVTLAGLGRMEEAVSRFEAAVRIKPDDGLARGNLAAGLLSLGRSAEAWQEARRARQLGSPVPEELRRALAERAPELGAP